MVALRGLPGNYYPVVQIAIVELNCTGSEKTLTDCPHKALDSTMCNQDDASVFCQPLDGDQNY